MDNLIKGEINSTPFNIIQDSQILTQDDWAILSPLTKELQETFKKSQVFRTRTEMEVSVLNDVKHPTADSKYWQATREQNVMFTELVLLSYEYRKNLIEIKKKQRDLDNEQDDLEKELIQVEIERLTFNSKIQERTAQDRIRELKDWSEIKERESVNMTKENLENVNNHQLISYTKRWIKQSIAMGMGGSPAERQNLLGQLHSGILACVKNNVIEEVLSGFQIDIQTKIRNEYKIK